MQTPKGMFFCDVDGTILPHGQREVSPRFLSLVREARQAGYLFCISSGRFHRSLLSLFSEISNEVVFSASNGCRVLFQEQDLLPLHTIERPLVEEITASLTAWGAIPLISATDAIYVPGVAWEGKTAQRYLAKPYTFGFAAIDEVKTPVLQITGMCSENKQAILQKARFQWENRYHVVTTGKELFDICPTSKGDSLVAVSKYFGIDREHTYAFGDDENDIPMLQASGKGYVMGTAHEQVKAHPFAHCHDLVGTIETIIATDS